ncbi:unnamed protein product [Symbiodinium microadriaticum]|nr:unnamed protein product [Symbiodinium microadriaticum]CAE7870919.1 unnamed protein product [Symbiodinium sp. KB8]
MQSLLNAANYDSFLKMQLQMPKPADLHRNCPLGKRVLAYRGDRGCTPEKLSCWRNATVADGPGRQDAYITVLWADGLTRYQRLHASYAKRWHSQQYQDSILHFLFLSPSYALPPRKTGPPFYVEFGYHGVQDSNTEYLRQAGWGGVRFDRFYHQPESGLFRQHITASNIGAVFNRYRVPSDLDFVSIDTDTCDLWIFAALVAPETRFRPRVVQIEMNRHDPLDVDRVLNCTSGVSPEETFPEHRSELGHIKYSIEGASVTAIAKVAKSRGYSVLYVEPCYDVYLLRSDLVCHGEEHRSLEPFRNSFARKGEKLCGDMHEWVAKNLTQDRVDRWCMTSDEMMEVRTLARILSFYVETIFELIRVSNKDFGYLVEIARSDFPTEGRDFQLPRRRFWSKRIEVDTQNLWLPRGGNETGLLMVSVSRVQVGVPIPSSALRFLANSFAKTILVNVKRGCALSSDESSPWYKRIRRDVDGFYAELREVEALEI